MSARVLDCDLVFETLTRGPFPTGSEEDGLIEAHLSCCDSCRDLADALRPAIDLFHESLDETGLPGYVGAVPEVADRAVRQVMRRVESEGASEPTVVQSITDETASSMSQGEHSPKADLAENRSTSRSLNATRRRSWDPIAVVLALVVGVVLGMLVARPSEPVKPGFAVSQAVAHEPSPEGLAMLRRLDLQVECRAVVSPHREAYACCTQCHTSNPKPNEQMQQPALNWCANPQDIHKLLQGCKACHVLEG